MNKTDLLNYLGLNEGGKEGKGKEEVDESIMKFPPDWIDA